MDPNQDLAINLASNFEGFSLHQLFAGCWLLVHSKIFIMVSDTVEGRSDSLTLFNNVLRETTGAHLHRSMEPQQDFWHQSFLRTEEQVCAIALTDQSLDYLQQRAAATGHSSFLCLFRFSSNVE